MQAGVSIREEPAKGKLVGAVIQSFAVMRVLSRASEAMGVSAIAREAAINPSTAFNILQTLVLEGAVAVNEQTKTYLLSEGLLALCAPLLERGFVQDIGPELERLSTEFGCLAGVWQVVGDRGWPIAGNVFVLGLCNGVFAVAAIGAMMGLAGAGERTREGVRMGVWGAAQAIAFGLGGLAGALGVDLARQAHGHDAAAFQLIFALEAALFVVAAHLAVRATSRRATARQVAARA
ncbi:PucC family protein [Leptolyngbya sp. 15MV]|nr:PucC family protein [Leptolyngbya sp. 15MV]